MDGYGGMILTGKTRRAGRKPCHSATLSTMNPTWIDPGAKPGLRGERRHSVILRFIDDLVICN
jgi:hypothetical protein